MNRNEIETTAWIDPETGSAVELLADTDPDPSPARACRRTFRAKLVAGLIGLKHAFRGDSSFFAHTYRGVLIALAALVLGVDLLGWALLVVAAALVLTAELSHSAIDTLARSLGDPDAPGPRVAREIASAGVLVAAVASATLTISVLTVKLGVQLGWW
ncbi:MAG TPA: diacylglycerol kinase [Isosphaeraceae bacterium]|jgi:diacylglycerol kinase (ATP)|nr:diacylglycerol kinase [Isosphaeraceae bacterium]